MKTNFITSAIIASSLIGFAPVTHAYNDVTLINALTNQPVGGPITYVREYNLTEIGNQINFRYNHAPEQQVKSVHFIVKDQNGIVVSDRIENQAPFAAFGDSNGDYFSFSASGTGLIIEARGYSEKFAQGNDVGGSVFVANFTTSEINAGLSIVNADSNATVASVSNGQTFSLSEIGSNLNLVAEFGVMQDQVGSVIFDQIVNGDSEPLTVENAAPYAIYGDINGNFRGQTFAKGTFTVRVRAFTGDNGTGEQLSRMTYVFNLTD